MQVFPLFQNLLSAALLLTLAAKVGGQVVISEIMYHPVEEPAFNLDGTPVLDLTEDVHEYIEIYNAGSTAVALDGWRLSGGIRYNFPAGATINPGEYRVVARDPARLAAVTAYGLVASNLFGTYEGVLSNQGETIRLRNAKDNPVDTVTYSASFPWAISADGLGAGEDWTGLHHADYQYRGRSLERVSFTVSRNDPANWLASPLPGEPSPGKPNAVHREVPLPVVIQLSVTQASDGQPMIRSNQPVRVDAFFSATNELGRVSVEYYLQYLNVSSFTTTNVTMEAGSNAVEARFTAVLPGFVDRTKVRYRIWAERAGRQEVVSPRADDPFAWHGYFVSPTNTTTNPRYDLYISNTSLNRLSTNINQSPRRVTAPDPPGYPRESWNATEPAVLIIDGVMRDIRVRYHGSRYNRNAGTQSYKFHFPRYNQLNQQSALLLTEKGQDNVAAYGIFRAAGLPAPVTRRVDLYVNQAARLSRLEIEDYAEHLLERYHLEQALLNPGQPMDNPGELYKSMGTIPALNPDGEGPYGAGNGLLLAPKSPYWIPLQRYEWTYPIQDHDWKGGTFFRDLIEGMWLSRGDTPNQLNPNLPALRAFLLEHFDVDKMLTYLAVINWLVPWDDTTQNHLLWQQTNSKWCMLPWDMDAMFGDASASIFAGETGDRSNNFRGPNYFKDSIIKAFRQEYKERVFLLNNTLLHPDNITALGYGTYRSFASSRLTAVNQQCGLGAFQRPTQPKNLAPAPRQAALPTANFQSSAYGYSQSPIVAHALTIWEIRTTNGAYTAPLFKLASTTNLTTLPIPFAQLNYGDTYFWRCTYVDASGHPSIPSTETMFVFSGGGLNSQFRIDAIRAAPGVIELQFTAIANLSYGVDYRNSLTLGQWEYLTNFAAQITNRTFTIEDPLPLGLRERYYRTRVP